MNDVVAYDAMRESATTLIALLLGATRHDPDLAQTDVAQLREDVLAVDAYDRDAVNTLSARINSRIADLSRESP
ncbi:hypothetical protein AB2L57_01065 [Microbacterium sp. HA-8]|uniref:hypothetical protein n=1 Tax=Microbacterium sp. HA-8 TaxID=3234200 RepID=UPI0038F6302F